MRSAARALALFSVVPAPAEAGLTRAGAVAALRWLPAVGGLLGGAAGLPLVAVRHWAPHAAFVGAVLSVCLMVLLTRALHLDGLADTADGLGARAPADRALAIMRRSDIGPFGVLAVVLVLLLDTAALTALRGPDWVPVAALATAAATGRLSVLVAAHRRVPSARETGFGAFVAGSVSWPVLLGEAALVLGGGAALAAAVSGPVGAWVAAQAGGLAVGAVLLVHVVRRLGGVTGDVFGALVEVGTAVVLAGLAFS